MLALGGVGPALAAGPLPAGGQVVAGSATLQQSGSTLTIQQASQRLVTDWRSFNIAPGNTVRFVQPSASAVALNRVLGAEPSAIDGSLLANGQIFLINPNGVIFGAGARVDTGGLVASTLALRDDDFMAGRYRLQGDSTAAVSNAGRLQTSGGTVALIAAQVRNSGEIMADRGNVVLASANDVTLDLGQTVQLQIHKGALDSLVDNGGAIRADGGTVLLTARAADELSRSVINQSGVVRARTLTSGERGEIVLLGDMAHGDLVAGGTLDASAPESGRGGFIETSAARVDLQPGLKIDAGARSGNGGLWLIDPYDYTINSTAAANISAALNSGTSVTVTTQSNVAGYGSSGSSSGNGDISVISPISKTGGGAAALTLRADRNILVSSAIGSTSGALDITLSAANNASSSFGGVLLNAGLSSNGGRILIGGAGGSLTSAQSYGIGYALNLSSTTPGVRIAGNVSITSAGGDITINGQSSMTASGTYGGTRGGVYVLSGATVDSGGGNIYISGRSTADDTVFGFSLEASSGTTTTFRTSTTTGGIFVDARNDVDALGSLGLTNNGSQARIQFWAPSVAHYLFRLNGSNQAATFTQSPPCNVGYPNCGTMVIPGGNQSYTSAGYNAVSTAMLPIYVFTGNGSRTYDGTTSASGVAVSALGGPNGFVVGDLGTLSFNTSSKNAGSYTSLSGAAGNPTSYQSGTYAVAYFPQGTYTVSQKTISGFQAGNKVYDGTTAASVSSSDIVAGDAVTVSATGGFTSASVGNGISVNVTGVSISGADAANYTWAGGGNISTTANITPAPLTVTAGGASKTYDGLAYTGGNGVSYSGFVNGETSAVLGGSLGYAGTAQGATNSGSYTITPQGLSASNYSLAYASGTLTVSPATLSYSANSASRTYGAANPSLSGSVSGFVNGETLASATTGTLGFGSAASATSNVGSYAVTGGGLTANNGNYVFTQAAGNANALSVTPAPLTVTASNASKTYDGLAYTGGNGVSYSGFVNGETSAVLAGSLSYTGTAQGATNAGSYAVTPQGLTSSNYSVSFASGSLTVNPAALTVTAANASKTYDGQAYTGGNGVSYAGLVNGETGAVLGGSLSYAGNAQGATNAGSYTITPQGLSASNYSLSYASGTLTVSPATLSYSANSASRTYGAANPSLSGSVSGFVNGETLASATTGTLGFGSAANAASNVGSYAITGGGLTANSGNYVFTQAAGNASALSVTPASLTVTASNASKTYDGLAFSGGNGVSYAGFVNGETSAVLGGTLGYAGTAQGATNVGSYTVTPQGLTSSNYSLSFASGSLAVNPATLTYSANATSRNYGSANPTLTGSVTGFVNGETLASATTGTLAFTSTADGSSHVGSYAVTGSGLSAGNYVLTQAAGNAGALNVTPAPLTVTAVGAGKTYDGLAYGGGAGVTYAGFVNGETASVLGGALSYGGTAQGATNAGSYTIVPQGLTASDYAVSFASNALTISPATLTYTAGAAGRSYGGTNPTLTGTVTGFVNGETLASATSGSASFATTATSTSNVGHYGVTGGGLGANHGNYVFVQAAGNGSALSIAPAALSVSAANATKTYDGLAYAGGSGVSYSGFVNGESAAVLGGSLSYAGSAQGATNAGSYAITPQGLSAGNYQISYTSGTLSVSPATLTYTANGATRTYGAANPTFGGTVTGFVNGETLASATTGTPSFGSTAGTGSNVGSYAVTGSGLSAISGNYVFTQASGNAGALSITPASLTVTAGSASKTYDGQAYSGGNGVSYVGFVNGETAAALGGTLGYAGSAQGAINAGAYAITPQGLSATNYQIAYTSGALTIAPATLTYGATGATRSYGATNPALTGTVTGFVNGETLVSATTGTLAFGTAANEASNVGSYAVTGSGLSANHGNYVFVQAAGNGGALGITPAALTVTAASASKTYDGQAFSGGHGVSYSGFVNGDTAAVLGGALTFGGSAQGATNAGSYTITPQGLSAQNYSLSFAGGSLTVAPATLTYGASAVSRSYGAANPALAGTVTGFVNGETLASATTGTLSFTTHAAATSNVGSHAISGGGLVANNGNYVFAQAAGNGGALAITPASLTVTGASATKTYDGLAFSGGGGVSYSGLVNGETSAVLGGTLSYGGDAQGATNAGSYAILPRGLSSPNYAISYVSGALSVTPATLTYVADSASRSAGTANPVLGGSVSGFVNGETLATATTGTLLFQSSADSTSAAGGYAIVGSGLVARNGNYQFVQAGGNGLALTVTAAQMSADGQLPRAVAVPNFPDNAGPALGSGSQTLPTLGGLNYVPMAASEFTGTPSTTLTMPTISAVTLALPVAGTAAMAPTAAAVTSTVEPTVGGTAIAPPVAAGGTNLPSTSGAGASVVALQGSGSITGSTPTLTGAIAPATPANVTGTASDSTAPRTAAASNATASPGSPAPSRTARNGTAGIPVSSANGPLDVFVIDGGINLTGAARR